MKKIYKLLISIFLLVGVVWADVDTKDGTAITTSTTLDGETGIDTCDSQTVTASGGGTECTSDTVAIGDNSAGASSYNLGWHDTIAFRYQATCSGDIDEIVIELESFEGQTGQAGVYSDDGGSLDTLIQASADYTGGAGENNAEITFTLDSAVTLVEDTYYWLAVGNIASGSFDVVSDTTGGTSCFDGDGNDGTDLGSTLSCTGGTYRGEITGIAQ